MFQEIKLVLKQMQKKTVFCESMCSDHGTLKMLHMLHSASHSASQLTLHATKPTLHILAAEYQIMCHLHGQNHAWTRAKHSA